MYRSAFHVDSGTLSGIIYHCDIAAVLLTCPLYSAGDSTNAQFSMKFLISSSLTRKFWISHRNVKPTNATFAVRLLPVQIVADLSRSASDSVRKSCRCSRGRTAARSVACSPATRSRFAEDKPEKLTSRRAPAPAARRITPVSAGTGTVGLRTATPVPCQMSYLSQPSITPSSKLTV